MPRGRPKKNTKKDDNEEIQVQDLANISVDPSDFAEEQPVETKKAGFDLLSMGSTLIDQTRESLSSLSARKKNIDYSVDSIGDLRSNVVKSPEFGLQYLLSSYGYVTKSIYELIGSEGIGKTTLLFTLMGHMMKQAQSPSLYINTESKWLNEHRTKRALSTDPEEAEKMYKIINAKELHELKSVVEYMEAWVKSMRELNEVTIPKHIPLTIGVDTLSKIMSPGEAMGFYNYADYMSEANIKKAKDLDDGSNLEFAKLMHKWCRRLPYWLSENNVIIFFVSHQNTKINMTGFGGPAISAEAAAGFNKTKIGGGASNQNSVAQITLKYIGQDKNTAKDTTAKNIEARCVKNTSGADLKTLQWKLNLAYTQDTDTYKQAAIDFSIGTADKIAEKGFFNTTVSKKRYTSDILGVEKVTAAEFMQELHKREDLISELCTQLEFDGFSRPPKIMVDTVEEESTADTTTEDE